jgi:DMSO/TMAO reductase YedYZ molybdopterin-dependent catalytic subunit
VTIDNQRSVRILVRGAIAGILAGGLALGVAQLVAGLISSDSSPVVAVGQLSIDFTPPPVKNFAIRAFGSHDKTVLVGGILVVLAIFAAAVGVLAMRRLAYGYAGLGLFAVVGLIAAVTRPGATAGDALPTLVGAVAALLALRRLVLAAQPPPALVSPSRAAGSGTARASGGPGAGGSGGPGGSNGASGADRRDGLPGAPRAGTPGAPGAADATGGAGGAGRGGRPGPGQWTPGGPGRRPEPEHARPGPPRRSFVTTSAVIAGGAVVAGLGGRLLGERASVATAQKTLRIPTPVRRVRPLPDGVNLKIPGLSSFITPNSSFYRVDTAIVLPEIPPSSWQLRIHGMVAREITLTFDDLIKRPLIEDYITLCCVSNPVGGPYIGNAKWLGTSLRSLLQQAGVKAGADQLLCTSSDGFTSGTPIAVTMDGRDAMLAVAMNGTVLPVEHGFPVRMVVPGLYGYVSACKWITDIEVTTFAASHAYWTVRGWSQQAPIKTESRIDVPSGSGPVKAGPRSVAGVAWAQHKGIEAVEVRVDRGPWHEARLAAVPGIDTWRQWTWEWPATPGTHLIEARATDRTGYTQTALQAAPEPNGASGYPQVLVKVS